MHPEMDAVVLRAPNTFAVERVPTPRPGRHEVLCRVETVFICGTDPHIIEGHYPGFWPRAYPFIPGHEWSGTVVGLGEGVAELGWRLGERVAGTSHCGCGVCRMCLIGRYNLCENYGNESVGHRQYGHYTQGAYAQYVVHSIKSVFKVPASLSLDEAAGMDPASIALHTVKRAQVGPGDAVAILGPGPMGLLVLQCARAVGAGRVIVVGRGDRLAKAAELDAETVDYSASDPVDEVVRMTGGGPQVVIDCAGSGASLAQAVEMCRKGGSISVIGIPLEAAALPIQKLVLQEISVHGVRANRGTCEEVLPLMADGRISIRALITHRFSLREFPQALETFVGRRGGALKVVLKPWA
ncbi:MAG: zinc-binding dehydrogenase [Chloroflexi bacterium]|nr:zinc-binding dehydrogenase [Chloroflexota bacterium]